MPGLDNEKKHPAAMAASVSISSGKEDAKQKAALHKCNAAQLLTAKMITPLA
jgi:hypothetical protein